MLTILVDIPFGGTLLQESNYNFLHPLDRRSKVTLEDQLFDILSRAIFEEKIIKEQVMPSPKYLAEIYQISLKSVLNVYQLMLEKEIIEKQEDYFIVSFHRFSHDYYGEIIPIIKLLEKKGYRVDVKKFPSKLLDEVDVSKKNVSIDLEGKVHEIRIDYYANQRLFATTYEYVPKSIVEDIDQALSEGHFINKYFKPFTSYLEPNTNIEAVTYPDWVCDLFKIPYGKAGMKTTVHYRSDQQQVVLVSLTYLTSWYEILLKTELE